MRIEKVPGLLEYPTGTWESSEGEKVRRKVVSPFKCLTDNDIMNAECGTAACRRLHVRSGEGTHIFHAQVVKVVVL